jgi:hypothetical protein
MGIPQFPPFFPWALWEFGGNENNKNAPIKKQKTQRKKGNPT